MRRLLLTLFRRRALERDLQDEIADHLARDIDFRVRQGASREDAVRASHARFGSLGGIADDVRDVHGATMLDDLRRDITYAGRRLLRAPGWAGFVILTIGLGIGATTTIYSVVDGVLLRPLPFRAPDELVTIWQARPTLGATRDDVAPANFLDVEARATSFAQLAAGNPYSVNLRGSDRTDNVEAWQVTEGFFQLLDRAPLHGRTFREEDFAIGSAPVVVLDHGFWLSRFGGDPGVIGRSVTLDERPSTVIGIMPPGVALPAPTALWMPWVPDSAQRADRFGTYIRVLARLKPEATPATAAAELDGIGAQLAVEYPRANHGVSWRVIPLREVLLGGRAAVMFILLGAAVLLLLVTLANVAALHVTRLAAQRRETAVRAALGATRARLIRPLVAESAWLALWGGGVGVLLALAGVRLVHRLAPADLPRLESIQLDGRAVAAAIVLTLVAAMLLALLGVRGGVAVAGAARGVAGGQASTRLRRAAVGFQLAIAVVLLAGTGLLVRSLVAVLNADRGYQTDRVLSFTTWVYGEYPEVNGRRAFVERVLADLGALPGVVAVSAGSALPLADAITGTRADIIMPGTAVVQGEEPQADASVVWPSWFETLGIPIRRGRGLTPQDDATGEGVIVVNEAFARRFSPGEEVLGRSISVGLMGRARPRRVVGVVGDTRHGRLEAPPEPAVFIPWHQQPLAALTFVLRSQGDPGALIPSIERRLFALDARVGIARVATMTQLVDAQVRERRFLLFLIGAFAATAVLLGGIGVAGVMAHTVLERTREIGVRLALGATPSGIRREVVGDALRLSAGGLLVGALAAAAGGRVLKAFLYEVSPLDLPGFGGAIGLLLVLVVVASAGPSIRASRIDPARVLQE